MTNHNLPLVFCMEMHRSAKTIPKHFAISTLTLLHPLPVAERLETVFPNIQKIVSVNVALHIAAVNVGASGNGAVNENRANGDTRTAEIEPVANLALVRTNVGLATELAIDFAFLSGRDYEVHKLTELFIAELQAVISGSATNWVNSKQTPGFNHVFNEQLLHCLQLAKIHWTNTGYNVVGRQAFLVGNQIDGTHSVVKAALAFAESVVRVAQPIKADGDAAHSRFHQLLMHGLVVSITVADDAPRKAMLPQLPPAVGQVGTHQRLATCDDHQNGITFELGFKRFNGAQEILERHVLVTRRGQTVRATMLTVEVAALRTLPKEVVQLMELRFLFAEIVMEGL